jgi:hypothetical protein
MAYRAGADTSNPWLPAGTQAHVGRRLASAYEDARFPLPHGSSAAWRREIGGLSGFYQKDHFVLPYGHWNHARRKSVAPACGCNGNPTPSKMATKMAQCIKSPALLPVAAAPPPQSDCTPLAIGIGVGAFLIFAASAIAKGGF